MANQLEKTMVPRQLARPDNATAPLEPSLLSAADGAAWAGFRVGLFKAESIEERNRFGEHPIVATILRGRTRAQIISQGEECDISPGPDSIGLFGPCLDVALSRWECEPGAERLVIELDFSDLEHAGDLDAIRPAGRQLRQNLSLRDSHLASLLRLIADEARSGSPHGPIYATSLSMGLAAYVFNEHAGGGRSRARERGGLGAAQKARVLELIQRRLAGPVGLDELAETAGLSRFHFLRLFKNSLGVTPHQFLLDQRIAAARRLLDQTEMPLAEIATATGFSSQSHLCTAMRRRLGLTPGQWRRR